MLKVRIPRILTPRRKYEVNESMWLVKFGRPKIATILRWGRSLMPIARSVRRSVASGGRKTVLFLQWRRMPKDWELSFVTKMKTTESQGIPFPEVLHANLPSVIGDAPSEVLLRWVGKKGRSQPKRFVKAVAETFGPSGKPIIVGLEHVLNPEEMLQAHRAPEEPFKSLIDAIQRADTAKAEEAQPMQDR
jgi:hypothetical protein